jgi:type I restriction enzyme, R subunit
LNLDLPVEANREIDKLLKPGVNVREEFNKNLRSYKQTIPQLFHYNALLLVSNGVQSRPE